MHYQQLIDVYEKLESTSKRLDKTYYISELLKNTSIEDLDMVLLLLQGRTFPAYDERKIGVASRLALKAINIATGIPINKIEDNWKKSGDLGITTQNITKNKNQQTLFSTKLTIRKVFNNIKKLAEVEGLGSVDQKTKLIAELIGSASPLEAKYIIRTVLEDLRVGAGEGSIRDAIVWAFLPKVENIHTICKKCKNIVPRGLVKKCIICDEKFEKKNKETDYNTPEEFITDLENNKLNHNNTYSIKENEREAHNYMLNKVQEAIDITNDYSEVAKTLKQHSIKGLEKLKLTTNHPIKVMLYQKSKGIEDAFETVGKPAAIEFKYDGFRLQLHKQNTKIKLFTRRLEDVTQQFPDVVELVKSNIRSDDFILDSEVIGIDPKTKKWLPFQNISQRIKRKYDIKEITEKVPIMVNIFDAVQIDGKNLIKTPFKERRDLLNKIVKEKEDKLKLAEQIITDNPKEAEKFYAKALKLGNEGIMVKSLEAPYKPGSRVGYGVKVKPTMENLDLVIVAAQWGEGKRASWLSSFTIACQDDDGNLLEIGKVGTGIKEKTELGASFEELTEAIKPLITAESGKNVTIKPHIVIEISYEEIQKSPTYSSGYALRFPRLISIREDKPVEEISSIDMVEELYRTQRS